MWLQNYYEQGYCGDDYNLRGEIIFGDVDQNHFVDEHIYFNLIEGNRWIKWMPPAKSTDIMVIINYKNECIYICVFLVHEIYFFFTLFFLGSLTHKALIYT